MSTVDPFVPTRDNRHQPPAKPSWVRRVLRRLLTGSA